MTRVTKIPASTQLTRVDAHAHQDRWRGDFMRGTLDGIEAAIEKDGTL